MKITKPGEYRMRNGLRAWVRFRRTNYNGPYPWVGERETERGETVIETWTEKGKRNKDVPESKWDLMPPEEVRYCNVYLDGGILVCYPFHKSIESAKQSVSAGCVGTIKFTTCGDERRIEVVEEQTSSDVRVFNRALNDDEIDELYDEDK